ncbi:MAG: hypothetical protein IJC87_00835 [Clostridia bacterium]|nr:hypothetical protein [Clostridia bacterium]
MSVLKWLSIVTCGLFATHERPIFLLFDENSLEISNEICNLLSYLGADVVSLCQNETVCKKDYTLYDGVFTITKKFSKVLVSFERLNGQKRKIYRKTFQAKNLPFR